MARPEKVAVVDEIRDKLENSGAVFITEYRGLSVAQQQELRRGLRATGAEYKVTKMSLARLAAEGAGKTELLEWLEGPTALAFTDADPVLAAKELKAFAAGNEFLVIKGGLLDGETLDQETFGKLADLEPREVLLAVLAGTIKAPLTKLAGLMSAVMRQPVTAMQQLLEKKTAETPAAEEPPEEPAAGEKPAADAAADKAAAGPEEEPNDEEPAAEAGEPAAEEGSKDPAAEEATAEEPADEEPDEPAVEEAAEEPTAEEGADEPAAEEAAEEPAAEEGADEPAAEEAAEKPADEKADESSGDADGEEDHKDE